MNAESRGPGTAVAQGIRDWGLGIRGERWKAEGGAVKDEGGRMKDEPIGRKAEGGGRSLNPSTPQPLSPSTPQPLNPSTPQPLSPNPQSLIPNPLRRGFTLVEILTVIVIIGLLVALVARAMGPVRARVKVARMKFEITQLAIALERVRNELGGGDYPPDGADLNTNSTSGGTPMDVQRWCRRAFPATLFYDPNNPPSPAQTGNYVPFPNVTPDTALVFWLGGIRDPSGAMMGFSADPANPFDISFSNSTGTVNPSLQTLNPSRIGPFFDFDKTRVMPVTVPAPASRKPGSAQIVTAVTGTPSYSNFNQVYAVYFPQNDLTITNTTVSSTTVYTPSPYLYFKAVAAKYSDTITSGKTDNSGEAYHVSAQGSLSNNLIYVTPLKDAKNAAMGLAPSNSTRAWMNPRSYQILCAGLDGFFGKSTTGNFIPVIATSPESKDSNNLYAPIYPDGLNYDASISGAATKNTPDDITNFSNGKLSDDAP